MYNLQENKEKKMNLMINQFEKEGKERNKILVYVLQ